MKKLLSIITFIALSMTAQLGMAADFPESKLNFELGKSELPAEASDAVAKVAAFLKATADARCKFLVTPTRRVMRHKTPNWPRTAHRP